MPELAEVEFYRKQWNPGVGATVSSVELNGKARIFRGCDRDALSRALAGSRFVRSETHGKKMLFVFSDGDKEKEWCWLGLHLGMTGKLLVAPADFARGKHEHLVLRQQERALVFSDFRQFGLVQFEAGKEVPAWWRDLPPAVTSRSFTLARVKTFLQAHGRAPVKAVILMQDGFPGVGNWMADEILWRARIDPSRPAGQLSAEEYEKVWRETREVSRVALRTIGVDFRDPPEGWLFHERWGKGGTCPCTGETLARKTVGGRTTCWSPVIQR